MATTLSIDLPGIKVDSIETTGIDIQIHAHSSTMEVCCPDCRQSTSSVHSHYMRQPQDLSSFGQSVRWKITVTRFRCRNPDCPRVTFAERLPRLVPFYARCTHRLMTAMRSIAFETGAEAGARVLAHLGIQTSGDTLLRLMRRTAPPDSPEPQVVGIDDWAFKKGLRYGTILIDLERHCPIDLLPDRQVDTVTQWLSQHPSIQIVTRDRSQDYAQAITAGAPQALQIADRWHLLKNLTDTLWKALEPHAHCLRQWAIHDQQVVPLPSIAVSEPAPHRAAAQETRHTVRQQRFQQIHQLHQQGWQQIAMARHLGICPRTVRRYLAKESLPPTRRHRTSKLDAYKVYLLQRWNEGCHNARQLADEIHAQGYAGGITTVRDYVARLRRAQVALAPSDDSLLPASLAARPLTPRRTAFFLLRPSDADDHNREAFLQQFYRQLPDLQSLVEPFQAFATIVREKRAHDFDTWLQSAVGSECVALRRFAAGLQQDLAAVRAALEFEWSNGQAEGQINRLKLIKRQMYGRAKFDLLRLRVLHPT